MNRGDPNWVASIVLFGIFAGLFCIFADYETKEGENSGRGARKQDLQVSALCTGTSGDSRAGCHSGSGSIEDRTDKSSIFSRL